MDPKEIMNLAVHYDREGCNVLALRYYKEGVTRLMDVMQMEARRLQKKELTRRIRAYIDRAEKIKMQLKKQKKCGKLIATKIISENSTGHTYESVFGEYLCKHLKEILIEEPCFMDEHELRNLISFLKVIERKCPGIKHICIETDPITQQPTLHGQYIRTMEEDMARRGIKLQFVYSRNIKKSRIVLFNGHILTLQPGLQYFKDAAARITLDPYDYKSRRCKETKISLYLSK